jgi:UDP-GlcNAc:undecaprenyl-phosphate GlcNAc-1-phosphate transferase
MLQFLCAVALAASGIRLTSLYGMFGIHEINIYWQYILTVMIIAGVTNAFNLMDGIDGLAGGLAFINLIILSIISFVLKQYSIFVLLMALSGAIIAFLKNNINPAKIFMGDGGSLFLGFLMPSVGILLIEKAAIIKTIEVTNVVLLVSAILIVPVFDSLRVYMWRVQRGESPFKADKTHLHHLFLTLGLNHKRTSFFIYGLELIILIVGLFLQKYAGISLGILIIIALFIFITQLLQLNYGVDKWSKVIRKMESTD